MRQRIMLAVLLALACLLVGPKAYAKPEEEYPICFVFGKADFLPEGALVEAWLVKVGEEVLDPPLRIDTPSSRNTVFYWGRTWQGEKFDFVYGVDLKGKTCWGTNCVPGLFSSPLGATPNVVELRVGGRVLGRAVWTGGWFVRLDLKDPPEIGYALWNGKIYLLEFEKYPYFVQTMDWQGEVDGYTHLFVHNAGLTSKLYFSKIPPGFIFSAELKLHIVQPPACPMWVSASNLEEIWVGGETQEVAFDLSGVVKPARRLKIELKGRSFANIGMAFAGPGVSGKGPKLTISMLPQSKTFFH